MAIGINNFIYETSTKTNVYTKSATIFPDGFTSVICVNSGNDTAYVNDNIPILPNTTFELKNRPDTVINEDFRIRFAGVGDNPNLAILRVYYKKIK